MAHDVDISHRVTYALRKDSNRVTVDNKGQKAQPRIHADSEVHMVEILVNGSQLSHAAIKPNWPLVSTALSP